MTKQQYLPAIIAIALIGVTWVVFAPAIHYPFINYDDPAYILERPQITSGVTWHGIVWSLTNAHGGNWHPLTSLSHMIDCSLFGLQPAGPHAINIALHSLTAALLFLLLWRMTRATWRSAIVAALFAVHPLRVESVVWIAERKDVLSAMLFMVTLLAYVSYCHRPSLGRYILVAACFACALMAKPMVVTAPAIMLLLDVWPLRRLTGRRPWRLLVIEKVPLAALAAASCVMTVIAQRGAISSLVAIPVSQRLGNALVTYAIYLRDTVWPERLALFYPLDDASRGLLSVVAAISLLVIVTCTAVWLRRRFPPLIIGWAWYLIMLLPVIGIVQVGLQSRADRYTYLPQIGLLVPTVWMFAELIHRRRLLGLITGAVVILATTTLAVSTRAQMAYWRYSESLWRHTLAVTTNNDLAHAYLADLYLREDRFAEATEEAQAALTIQPNDADAENNLGMSLYREGELTAAATHWQRALELRADHANAEANYAWLSATSPDPSLRDCARAVRLAQTAVAQSGRDHAGLLRTLGAAYAECGRFDEAINAAHEALAIAQAQHDTALVGDLQLNIRNYEQRLPLRDPGRWGH